MYCILVVFDNVMVWYLLPLDSVAGRRRLELDTYEDFIAGSKDKPVDLPPALRDLESPKPK